MIVPTPKNIYYCYQEWQPLYDTIIQVQFYKGMIDIEELNPDEPNLIICDDMMEQCDQRIAEVFTKHSHHRNLSLLFLTQNLYQKGQRMRNMNLNSSYLVLFKNPREINQISYLARQMYPPELARFLQQAFVDGTSQPYGYLLIDLKQNTPDLVRVRTGVFPDERTYIYTHKSISSSLAKYSPTVLDHVS
jgi:hypothetical protein